ncbi:MAG TPA: class II aldolase/adducin family protein [Candidatus Kapabacteria bacterium]|nr:class II aldolase/adducin family protein [Candidatus Kapabacteria bacterium]
MNTELFKSDIVNYAHRLYNKQLISSSGGNISVRAEDNYLLITPSGLDKGNLTESDICLADFDGNLILRDNQSRNLKLSMESQMHIAIYKTRSDIRAIIHSHPIFASAYSSTQEIINTHLTGEIFAIVGNPAYVEYARMGSSELAELVGQSAIESNVQILANHGVIAYGKDLFEAYNRTEIIEYAAHLTFLTKLIGSANPLNDDKLKSITEFLKNR